MNQLALDTNALIRFLREDEEVSEVFSRYDRLLIPAATDAEFRTGLEASSKRGRMALAKYEELLNLDSVCFVSADERVSSRYAELTKYLLKVGKPIPSNDIWIASAALVCNATLCTGDAHFNRVPLLRIEKI